MTLLFILPLLAIITAAVRSPGTDAVLLSDVQALTLHWDQQTTGRRSAPQPQLLCVGGSGRELAHTVKTVQCRNQGHDGRDFQWRCEGQLDPRIKLGRLAVSCEGYREPNDEWILVGSCGLEYELDLFPQPQQQQQPKVPPRKTTTTTTTTTTHSTHSSGKAVETTIGAMIIAFFIFVIIVGLIMHCSSNTSSTHQHYYDSSSRQSKTSQRDDSPPKWKTSTHRVSPSVQNTSYTTPIIQTPVQPTVIVQQPAVVHHYPSSSGYVDGFVMGSLLNQKPVVTTTTTVHHTESSNDSWFPSSSGSSSESSNSNDTTPTTSVGFGGTRRR